MFSDLQMFSGPALLLGELRLLCYYSQWTNATGETLRRVTAIKIIIGVDCYNETFDLHPNFDLLRNLLFHDDSWQHMRFNALLKGENFTPITPLTIYLQQEYQTLLMV